MHFTVYGASGFVGSNLVVLLRGLGHRVTVPLRGELFGSDKKMDLGHVIWAVGLTADFRARPYDTVEGHIALPSLVLKEGHFASFLYLSSTRVYQRSQTTDENQELVVSPTNPDDLYNLSKLVGEAICISSGRENVRIARLSNVVGPAEFQRETFLGAICRSAIQDGRIRLLSDPRSEKDYIWIDDVAQILVQIAVHGTSQIYNVARGVQTPHQLWIEGLVEETGCTFSLAEHAPLASFPRISSMRLFSEFPRTLINPLDQLPKILGHL